MGCASGTFPSFLVFPSVDRVSDAASHGTWRTATSHLYRIYMGNKGTSPWGFGGASPITKKADRESRLLATRVISSGRRDGTPQVGVAVPQDSNTIHNQSKPVSGRTPVQSVYMLAGHDGLYQGTFSRPPHFGRARRPIDCWVPVCQLRGRAGGVGLALAGCGCMGLARGWVPEVALR